MLKLRISGFTFTELMIALTINGFLFLALMGIFIGDLDFYKKAFNSNMLYTQLQAAMDVMASDIRRAGYWSLASTIIGTGSNTNPFQASGTDITIGTGNNCILLTYDHTKSGALPAISASYDDLRYGYRLISGAIQSRPWGATFSCGAAASAWTNITDPNTITISNLTFTLNTQTVTVGSHTIAIRSVAISITGALTSDSTVTQTLTETVRVANDKYT